MKDNTKLILLGCEPKKHQGIVNPPVYHASTIVYPNVTEYMDRGKLKYKGTVYGSHGTPTVLALAKAVAELEGGFNGVVTSTGLSAITVAITGFVKSGDHILVVDSTYGPTRNFCDNILSGFGVETTYYDPCIGGGIEELIKENTRIVFTESPGSFTFEVQDIPAISAAAHKKGALVMMDNTWASPLFFKPFEHGVDISIQAATKYIGGHSDLVMGIITAKDEKLYRRVKDIAITLGEVTGPDDCYLALRGFRTMGVRLEHQQKSALAIANWLQKQPEVKKVLYPPLPDDPGHKLWKRDFIGGSSLLGIVLDTNSDKAAIQLIEGLKLFKIGASWGGFESLVLPGFPQKIVRTAVPWTETGCLMRFYVGLEDPQDLMDDLSVGFDQLRKAL